MSETIKSPFVVIEEFISPLECEDILSRLDLNFPNVDKENHPIKTCVSNKLTEIRLLPYIEELIPSLEKYYDCEIEGVLPLSFEWYPEKFKLEEPRCENSALFRGEWKKVNDHDFCAILFLKDYQEEAPFDIDFEVYGGKLEFPTHNFSFLPKRGTLIIFPGNEYFINHTSDVYAGSLLQVRFHMVASVEKPFKYNSKNFKGDYNSWF